MVKVELSSLFNKKFILLFLLSFIVTGCSKNAPDLPEDYSSVNTKHKLSQNDFEPYMLELNCNQINQEIQSLNKINKNNVNEIKANRNGDQAKGYFSLLLFPPLWFAIDTHDDVKAKIDEVNRQKDSFYKLQIYKECKGTS